MPDPHVHIGPVLDLCDAKGAPPLLVLTPTGKQAEVEAVEGYRWQESAGLLRRIFWWLRRLVRRLHLMREREIR